MDETLHIASLVVLARPELFDAVKANLRLLDNLELHHESTVGKLVVVLEARHEDQILQRIEQISNLPGVLNAALIYHELLDPAGDTQ
ncbi:periplasmic nitrate reductase chaperone NapD [Pseudomonas sp. ok272]|uniref:chaperone NapD n=1 Tax=unclassified Pseudomonas TaxID=196821 RepID=UPI0008C0FF54|nr:MULTISPECIES: chaperone NapD [unclassified Pseudomonas]SEM47888.1 periplasmic nitrate reductase chaperone NapD [Pseudomonas sp. ok272]SFM19458.1 periplasmic nitrate reductase chaperone NapD [Pseudomonas sp. ok602]